LLSNAAATLAVNSGGSGDASVLISSPAGANAKLALQEGSNKFEFTNDASRNSLVLTDSNSNDLITVAHTSGDIAMRGDVVIYGNTRVGGYGTTGNRTTQLISQTAEAQMVVSSGGGSPASLQVRAPTGASSTIHLTNGAREFQLKNDGADDTFKLRDENHDLLTVTHTHGDLSVRGDLSVYSGTNGAKLMELKSKDQSSTLRVESGGTGEAKVVVEAS
jgi:uncharacterized phosphosugar-binding protein